MLELCVGFCDVADLRAVVCRLVTESRTDDVIHAPLLASISHWAVLSSTELIVAVECLQHICEVTCAFVNSSRSNPSSWLFDFPPLPGLLFGS